MAVLQLPLVIDCGDLKINRVRILAGTLRGTSVWPENVTRGKTGLRYSSKVAPQMGKNKQVWTHSNLGICFPGLSLSKGSESGR